MNESPVKIWRRQKVIRKLLGKKGHVITWTKIHISGASFKPYAPYPVVLVHLEKGNKVFGQLVDCSDNDLKIGLEVESVLRKVRESSDEGVISYGLKFRPVNH